MTQARCVIMIGGLGGPALVHIQQEEILGLGDRHLHIHFVPEVNRRSAGEGIGEGVVFKQGHLNLCIQLINPHNCLTCKGQKSHLQDTLSAEEIHSCT